MKKILSLALVIVMLAFVVTACGGGSTPQTSSSPAGQAQQSSAPAESPAGGGQAQQSTAPAGGQSQQSSTSPAAGGQESGGFTLPTGVPTLASTAAQRAEDAYAFIAELAAEAAKYDRNAATRYTLDCQDPAGSAPAAFLYGWSDAVLIATEGAVNIEVGVSNAFSSGGPMVSLDDTKAGLIDFVWTLPCYYVGYMPLTLAIQNASLGIKTPTVGMNSMWELYKTMPVIQEEFANHGELMFVWTNGTSPLSYKGSAEISSASDIKGNIRGNNGPTQMLITELGASIFACPIGDVYPNVQNGVLDFMIADWHAIHSFKLFDPGVLNYYLDVNVGCSAYALIGNSDTWDRIVRDGYGDAIKSVSGDFCLNMIGIWEDYEAMGRADAISTGGTIFQPSAALAADLQAAYDSVAQQWIAANGPNAQAVYDKAVEIVNKYNGIYGQ